MCSFTLSTLDECGHELPTISYCSKADAAVKKYERAKTIGGATKPPKTCTSSLGWMLYKDLDTPINCNDCKLYLCAVGKRTYGGIKGGPGREDEDARDEKPKATKKRKAKESKEKQVKDSSDEESEKGEGDQPEDLSKLLSKGLSSRPLGNATRARRGG